MYDSSYEQGQEYAKGVLQQYMRREALIPIVVRRLRETAQKLDEGFDSVVMYCQQRINELKVSLEQDTVGSRACVEEEIAACTERLERLKIAPSTVSPQELKRRYDFMADAAEALFMKYGCDVDINLNPVKSFFIPEMPKRHPTFEGVPSAMACDFDTKQFARADHYAQFFQTEKVSAHRLKQRQKYESREAERVNSREPGTGWTYRNPPVFLRALHVPVPHYVTAYVGIAGMELPSLYDQNAETRELGDKFYKGVCDTLHDMGNLIVEYLQNICLKGEFFTTDSDAHVLFNVLPNTVHYSDMYGADGQTIPPGKKCWRTEFDVVIMWGEPSEKLLKIVNDYITAGRPMAGKVFVEL